MEFYGIPYTNLRLTTKARLMTLTTQLTQKLGIQHPIMLAPMGSVAGGKLAAAVSEAGGLGMIGAGYGDPVWLEAQLKIVSAATQKPWGVGFITWCLTDELLDLVLQYSPHAIMLSFGDISPWIQRIRAHQLPVFSQVHDIHAALLSADKGADFIVAQGTEAGGHGSGQRSTLPLVRGIKKQTPYMPVIAAGGIADGAGMAACMNLGAEGVLMGSRFYASDEALAPMKMKQRLVECNGDDTVRTQVFDVVREIPWPTQYTGRAITNKFIARWHGKEAELKQSLSRQQPHFYQGQKAEDPTIAITWAGESIDAIFDIKAAADIVEETISTASSRLRQCW